MVLKRCVPLGLCALSVLYFLVLDGVCAESSPAVVSSAEFAKEKAPKALPVLDMTIPDLSKGACGDRETEGGSCQDSGGNGM